MRPLSRVLALAASVVAVACFELSGPTDGIVSISSLIAEAPSVAIGDVMRNEVADTAPLQLFAFDVNGDTIKTVGKRFVSLDTSIATVDENGVIRGERATTSFAEFVGQVADADFDTIQTPLLRIRIVERPTMVDVVDAPDTLLYRVDRFDTLSVPFGLRVGRAGAPITPWLVRFYLDSSTVESGSSIAPVQIVGTTSTDPRDTVSTDAEGRGVLRLRIIPAAISAASKANGKLDAVVVRATTVFYPDDKVSEVTTAVTRFRFIIGPR